MATNKDKPWKAFVVNLSLLLLLFTSGLFLGISVNMKNAIEAELISKARAIFDGIVLARSWNAHYGGVYVEKKPGVESNPYLRNPDIEAAGGTKYTKKNPALMTREISEIAEIHGAFKFHITSLRPVNPGNAPDELERSALAAFEKGEREVTAREKVGDVTYFRYMAPLFVEDHCLTCHAVHGYKVGQVRGGISVKFSIDEAEKALGINRMITVALFVLTSLTLLSLVYAMIFRLYRKLSAAEERMREMAITDELTGLHNRRYLFERLSEETARAARYGEPLCLILFDLDHFKRINDDHGHDVGDQVLRKVGVSVRECCRQADTGARYGGEEFALLLPQTGEAGAAAVAEKLRAMLETLATTLNTGETLHFTASFGVAGFQPGDEAASLIKRADQALYQAKAAGRNRVKLAAQPA